MASTPTLRVDTSQTSPFVIESANATPSPSSPRSASFGTFSRDRARSISQAVLPSFRISSVGGANKSNDPAASTPRQSVQSHGLNRARNESRKLLAHILSQLQTRPVPPSLLSTLVFGTGQNDKGSGSVMKSVKGAVKYTGTLRTRTHQPLPQEDPDSEDEDPEGFTTDTTLDLLNQLKDVLCLSIAHSWDIFYDR